MHGTIPYEQWILPNPGLAELIRRLPQRKWLFTNADRRHADVVLGLLGMTDIFEGIIRCADPRGSLHLGMADVFESIITRAGLSRITGMHA